MASRPSDAVELALKFDTSTNPNIFAAVANYFAEEASPQRFEWFENHLKNMKGNELYQVLGIFGSYLVKSSPEIQLKSLPLLAQIATKDSQWYVRFAGVQTLALIDEWSSFPTQRPTHPPPPAPQILKPSAPLTSAMLFNFNIQ